MTMLKFSVSRSTSNLNSQSRGATLYKYVSTTSCGHLSHSGEQFPTHANSLSIPAIRFDEPSNKNPTGSLPNLYFGKELSEAHDCDAFSQNGYEDIEDNYVSLHDYARNLVKNGDVDAVISDAESRIFDHESLVKSPSNPNVHYSKSVENVNNCETSEFDPIYENIPATNRNDKRDVKKARTKKLPHRSLSLINLSKMTIRLKNLSFTKNHIYENIPFFKHSAEAKKRVEEKREVQNRCQSRVEPTYENISYGSNADRNGEVVNGSSEDGLLSPYKLPILNTTTNGKKWEITSPGMNGCTLFNRQEQIYVNYSSNLASDGENRDEFEVILNQQNFSQTEDKTSDDNESGVYEEISLRSITSSPSCENVSFISSSTDRAENTAESGLSSLSSSPQITQTGLPHDDLACESVDDLGNETRGVTKSGRHPILQVAETTSHQTQTTHWLPPSESWESTNGLPYGWECGIDKQGKAYYINHVDKATTHADPRDDPEYVEPPKPREVELLRDSQLGFGFVAGSEKPVIVRFVTEGGPSEDKLLPGDQIIQINGEDVKKAPREYVIDLVRSCKTSVVLTVCQPHIDNSTRKSALLTAAKKARLKSNPSRVRFAESITVNGAPVVTPSTCESYIPFMPNVLKVFLENGQTKSFKYDNNTTVKDVLNALQEKLGIRLMEHFALVLQNMKGVSQGKMSLIHEHESLAEIAARPGSQHFKCLFRVAFVPKDAYDLLRQDAAAFEYFFTQCCNDVVQGRFSSELKYDTALRLAALQIQQHVITNNMPSKLSVKAIEKECGLDRFVPAALLSSMKAKDLRKMIGHFMKTNQNLTAPGQKTLTALQAKLHYIRIVSELRSYGGKLFIATLVERKTEAMLLVGPKCGIAVVTNIKTNTLAMLSDFESLDHLTVAQDGDSMLQIQVYVRNQPVTTLSMLTEDAQDFIALVEGYHRLFIENGGNLLISDVDAERIGLAAMPPYHSQHQVAAASWSYTEDVVKPDEDAISDDADKEDAELNVDDDSIETGADTVDDDDDDELGNVVKQEVDLSQGPPAYEKRISTGSESESSLTGGVGPVTKPSELRTQDFVVTAPLASPDTSNISSSESSITTGNSPERDPSARLSLSIEDGELIFCKEIPDSDSPTDSSVATVISRQSATGASTMNGSLNSYDARFGVTSFRTFSGSDGEVYDTSSASVTPTNDNRNIPLDGDLQNNNQSQDSLNISSEHLHIDHEIKSQDNVEHNVEVQGHHYHDNSLSDAETESSLSETIEADRQPLMRCHSDYTSYQNEGVQSESDDTDSMSTPTDSPSKGRLESLDLKPPPLHKDLERPQSFGLHSPDQLPKSETEFKEIASSFGLHSPDSVPLTEENLHPSYNPRLFCDGGLYLDPDIIDLTLIPPPKTPDDETLIDFTSLSMSVPPPGFDDSSSPPRNRHNGHAVPPDLLPSNVAEMPPDLVDLPPDLADLPTPIRERIDALVHSNQDLSAQLEAMDAILLGNGSSTGLNLGAGDPLKLHRRDLERECGVDSETDSGNETISSENVDLSGNWMDAMSEGGKLSNVVEDKPYISQMTDDIDALIASLTVPPPPHDSPDQHDLPPPPEMQASSLSIRSSRSSASFPPPPDSNSASWDATEDSLVLEDEYMKWVIPPPPSSNGEMDELKIVPPIEIKSPSMENAPHVSELIAKFHNERIMTPKSGSTEVLRAVVRPVQSSQASDDTEKIAPPQPPQRISSMEGSATSLKSSDSQTSIDKFIHIYQRNTDIKSADSSPVHRGKDLSQQLSGSSACLSGSRSRIPPPPPPRRSSIPVGHSRSNSTDGEGNSPSPSYEHPQLTLDNRKSNYVNLIQSHSGSDPTLCKIVRCKSDSADMPKDSVSSQESKTEEIHVYRRGGSVKDNQSKVARRQAELKALSTFGGSPQKPKPLSVSTEILAKAAEISEKNWTIDKEDTVPNPEPEPEIFQPECVTKGEEEPVNGESPDDDGKLSSRHRSPSFTRKLLTFELGNSQDNESETESDSSSSKAVNRSQTFTQSSSPKGFGSPKSSPLLHRHSSFGKLAERAASPLRSLFGGGSSDRKSISSESSDTSSAPPSPRRSLRSSWTLSRSQSKPFGSNGSQSKDTSKRGIPLRIVHPLMSTSNPDPDSTTATLPANWEPPRDRSCSPSPIHREWAAPIDEDSRASNRTFSTFRASPKKTRDPSWKDASKSYINTNNSNGSSPSRAISSQKSSKSGQKSTDYSDISPPLSPPPGGGSSKQHPVIGKEKSSEERSGSIADIITNRKYAGPTAFTQANEDVDELIKSLDSTMNDVNLPSCRLPTEEFQSHKDDLVSEARQFVTDSKLLVSSATQSSERLVENVNTSIHTLAKITHASQYTMLTMAMVPQAHNLGNKVKEVAAAYKMTVNAAYVAAGRPLSDPYMKTLMRQATTLAAILSELMKTLKILDNS